MCSVDHFFGAMLNFGRIRFGEFEAVWASMIIYFEYLAILFKVLKSEEPFLKVSIAQKMNETLDKMPYETRAEFCQIFRSFVARSSFKKNCFWDLLTFRK